MKWSWGWCLGTKTHGCWLWLLPWCMRDENRHGVEEWWCSVLILCLTGTTSVWIQQSLELTEIICLAWGIIFMSQGSTANSLSLQCSYRPLGGSMGCSVRRQSCSYKSCSQRLLTLTHLVNMLKLIPETIGPYCIYTLHNVNKGFILCRFIMVQTRKPRKGKVLNVHTKFCSIPEKEGGMVEIWVCYWNAAGFVMMKLECDWSHSFLKLN